MLQVNQQREIIDKATIMVHYESKSGQSSCSDRQMESFIKHVCDRMIITTMHPRTSILINLVELHDDGCLSACAINATMLALANAGIPMRHLVSAATCCIDRDECVHIDPNSDLIEQSIGTMTLVVESDTKQILSLSSKGSFTTDLLTHSIDLLTKKCIDLFTYFRIHLSESNLAG